MRKIIVWVLACVILLTLGYGAHDGVFFAGKTKITAGNRTVEESRTGGPLGVATGGIYRLETLFGIYNELPDIKITYRDFSVQYPAQYTGSSQNALIIPGAQLHFVVAMKNITGATANNCLIEDIVPEHTHLYTAVAPTLVGNCLNIAYEGATTNAGVGSPIRFRFDMSPHGSATFNYTVTVD